MPQRYNSMSSLRASYGSDSPPEPPPLPPRQQDPHPGEPYTPERPLWASDEPLHTFIEHAPLLTLDHAILINTPFVGPYYISAPPYASRASSTPPATETFPALPLRPAAPQSLIPRSVTLLQTHQHQNQVNGDHLLRSPSPPLYPQAIALAVFARFPTNPPSSPYVAPPPEPWFAIRKIYTSPSDKGPPTRQTSLTWVPLSHLADFLAYSCTEAGYQVFVPNSRVCDPCGDISIGSLRERWQRELIKKGSLMEWLRANRGRAPG